MHKPMSALFVLVCMFVNAQNVAVRGFILDKQNNQPLSLCAVQVKNSQLGALTEDNGFFELPLPVTNLNDSVKISFIGYLPKTISIAGYKQGDTLKIYLETAIETKQEAVIIAENAKGVLLKAITNLKQNLYRDSIIETGFYRQFHKENGTFVRLIEADISLAINCKDPYTYSFHEQIQTNQQRRSESYETNGDNHGDHLVDLLKENPFSYNKSTFLNPKNLDFFAPKFEKEDSNEYIIKTQYKESSSAKLERARIWVQKGTYAITRIEVEKFPNPYYIKSRYAYDSRWKLVNETDVVQLTKYNGKFVVSSLERVYNHHVLNRQTGQVDYVVEESFDLYFYKYDGENVSAKIKNGRFSDFTSLYTSNYSYNDKFWNTYPMLNEHPLSPQIDKDLSHAKPLDQQFHEMGK
jgi:CarboxypepD_reg-like domain